MHRLMKKSHIFLTLALLAVTGQVRADNNNLMIEVLPDKKVIHVDRLGLSDNCSASEVMMMIPELLTRGDVDPIENYSVQIDDRDVGLSKASILVQTRVAEIDVIEISVTPEACNQKNGEGGVINIKLKPVTQEGWSGIATAEFTTHLDVVPGLFVNFKKDRFVLRSSLLYEHYDLDNDSQSKIISSKTISSLNDTVKNRQNKESFKINMKYNFNERNVLEINLWEAFSKSNMFDYTFQEDYKDVTNVYEPRGLPLYRLSQFDINDTIKNDNFTTEAFLKYTNTYKNGGEFVAQAAYSYNPSNRSSAAWTERRGNFILPSDSLVLDSAMNTAHQITSEIKTKNLIFRRDDRHGMFITGGLNTANTICTDSTAKLRFGPGKPLSWRSYRPYSTVYLSPYLLLEMDYGKWTFRSSARYQYYNYHYRGSDPNEEDFTNNSVTFDVSAIWRPAAHHSIRLMGARNQTRIASDVFPVYNAELNYIFDWSGQDRNGMANLCALFVHKDVAQGHLNLFNLNAQVFYEFGSFTMAFAGNVYTQKEFFDTDVSSWYYNLNLTPLIMLGKGWQLSGKFTFNSPIEAYNYNLGECFFAMLRAGKSFGKWDLHIEFDDVLGYVTTDTFNYTDQTVTKSHDLYQRALSLGASYKF